MDTYIGTTQQGYDIYRDSRGQCYLYDPYQGIELYNVPCPGTTQTPQVPPVIGGGVSTGGVLIQSGHSWYEDFLNTLLGLSAIGNQAPYIPSTAIPPKPQPTYIPPPVVTGNNNSINTNNGGGVLEDVGGLVRRNAGWILIGGVAYYLFKSGRK